MKVGGIEIKWLGHSGFLLNDSKTIYIDPYNLKEGLPGADFILITHSHYDHCSIADIKKIVKEGTRILLPADCQSKIMRFDVPIKVEIVEPGREFDFTGLRIIAMPAYNNDKPFHPAEEGWVGYLIKLDEVLVYHAGDTDVLPEMQKLTGHKQAGREFVALLPVGGRFTMTAEEAAEAAKLIKPTIAIPMHYGSVVGSDEDARDFVEFCKEGGINSVILDKDEK